MRYLYSLLLPVLLILTISSTYADIKKIDKLQSELDQLHLFSKAVEACILVDGIDRTLANLHSRNPNMLKEASTKISGISHSFGIAEWDFERGYCIILSANTDEYRNQMIDIRRYHEEMGVVYHLGKFKDVEKDPTDNLWIDAFAYQENGKEVVKVLTERFVIAQGKKYTIFFSVPVTE